MPKQSRRYRVNTNRGHGLTSAKLISQGIIVGFVGNLDLAVGIHPPPEDPRIEEDSSESFFALTHKNLLKQKNQIDDPQQDRKFLQSSEPLLARRRSSTDSLKDIDPISFVQGATVTIVVNGVEGEEEEETVIARDLDELSQKYRDLTGLRDCIWVFWGESPEQPDPPSGRGPPLSDLKVKLNIANKNSNPLPSKLYPFTDDTNCYLQDQLSQGWPDAKLKYLDVFLVGSVFLFGIELVGLGVES